MNLILGGDVGKTTILDAAALLLTASNATTVSEADYWRRDNTSEFSIEGAISLPAGVDPSFFSILLMAWEWDGKNAVLPADPSDGKVVEAKHPVYRLACGERQTWNWFGRLSSPTTAPFHCPRPSGRKSA